MQAKIDGYGTVEFNPAVPDDNSYDLFCVCLCEDEQVVEEEHYVSQDEYRDAIYHTPGRELMDEREEPGFCDIDYGYGCYECSCEYHFAYVIDHEEE